MIWYVLMASLQVEIGCAKSGDKQRFKTEDVIELFKEVHEDMYGYSRVVYQGY